MTEVVFQPYPFRIVERGSSPFIFDVVRRKYVALTPEEWVRQHILHYLIDDKKYPKGRIAVERGLELNGLHKRFDVVVFSTGGHPQMLVECKAPSEPLNEKVMEQIARYNQTLRVKYIWVSNGTHNFCWELAEKISLLKTIPAYASLV